MARVVPAIPMFVKENVLSWKESTMRFARFGIAQWTAPLLAQESLGSLMPPDDHRAKSRRMKSFKSRFFSAILMVGIFLLLPMDTAHAQESFTVEMTVESTTVNSQTGQVIVIGTVTCSVPAVGFVGVDVTQPVGRQGSISGADNAPVACDQTREFYILSIFAFDGRFKPGTAVIEAFISACTTSGVCASTGIPRFAMKLEPQK
jgi:hypothetical protein